MEMSQLKCLELLVDETLDDLGARVFHHIHEVVRIILVAPNEVAVLEGWDPEGLVFHVCTTHIIE